MSRAKQEREKWSVLNRLVFLGVFVFMEIIYLVIYFYYGLCTEAIKLADFFYGFPRNKYARMRAEAFAGT